MTSAPYQIMCVRVKNLTTSAPLFFPCSSEGWGGVWTLSSLGMAKFLGGTRPLSLDSVSLLHLRQDT